MFPVLIWSSPLLHRLLEQLDPSVDRWEENARFHLQHKEVNKLDEYHLQSPTSLLHYSSGDYIGVGFPELSKKPNFFNSPIS